MASNDSFPDSSTIARDILNRYRQVYRASRTAEPFLRYGRRTVAVSTIAQQFYCEKAVALSFERPLAPTQDMRDGSTGHEAVAALGVPMTQEEAVTAAVAAREQPLCLCEFRIGWQHHTGVTVLGHVDEAWFREGHVEIVAERKFSNSRGIHLPYHIQASLYCLGLGEMGFNTGHTLYRISVLTRSCHDCGLLRSGGCPALSEGIAHFQCDHGECTGQVFPFEHETTSRRLDWALQFWINEREAQPTEHTSRCRHCRYRRVCDAGSR